MSTRFVRAAVSITLIWSCASISMSAAPSVAFAPPSGWVFEADPSIDIGNLPTRLFTAPTERDAEIVLTEIGPSVRELVGGKSLKDFHIDWFNRLSGKKPSENNLVSFSSEHAEFWVSVFEDPRLKGKPVVRGDFKYSIQITGLIDNVFVVNCTLLSQEKAGKDLEETKAALMQARIQ